jgi:PAS domain S-box-containing protein
MYGQPKVKSIIAVVGLLSILVGVTVIVGWLVDIEILRSFIPGYLSMKFNPALCFIFLGVALFITQFPLKKYNDIVFITLSFFILLLSSVSFAEDIFHFNAGIDELFIGDMPAKFYHYPFPGRMAANTAFCFTIIGLSFLSFYTKNRTVITVSQYLLHIVTAISAVAIIGYLYGLSLFYNLAYISSMAIHTAVILFLTSIAASLLNPSIGIAALFTGRLVGNKMARRIFTMFIFMIVIFGSIRIQSEHYKLFSFQIGISLLALAFILVSLVIIWQTALWLNKNDLKRYEAEEEITVMNEELEERVEERTAEINDLLEKYQESELRFRNAFEYSPIGMALIGLTGHWLRVNKRWSEMVGYSEEELLLLKFTDITHPEDVDLHVNLRHDALNTETKVYQYEKRYITKSGAILWVSVNFTALRNNQGGSLYFISQFEDITERKKAESDQKRIIENEERLRAVFENVEGAVCLVDTKFRLLVFNKVFTKTIFSIAGYEPEVGQEGYGFLAEEEKQRRYKILENVLAGNKEVIEADYERESRHYYFRTLFNPVIVDGKVTAICAYVVDLTSWMETENKVRKANARFKAIVESVFVGVKLNDSDWGIIYRSPSMQAINGWTDEEMARMDVDLIHPDDREKALKVRQEVLLNPGVSYSVAYRLMHKNGEYVWIESLISNELADPDLGAIITLTRDVTKRTMVEDQLIKSEEKYRSLVENASDAIYLRDFEGNFKDANESMFKMTGYSKEELLKLNIDDLIAPEDLAAEPVRHGPMDTDATIIRERKFIRKDGSSFYVEINVKQFGNEGILVIARDITDRKRLENELREAELKFRSLAEKSMVGVYISQKQAFTYVNPRFAEIFGYEQHELINTPTSAVDIIISEEDREKVWNNVQARYKGDMQIVNYEVNGRKKDGTKNRVEFYGTRVIIDGEPSIIGSMMDVTERRNAEEVLKRSEANLKTIMDTTDTGYILLDKELSVMAYNQVANKFLSEQFKLSADHPDHPAVPFPKPGYPQHLIDRIDEFRGDRLKQFVANANRVLQGEHINYEIDYLQPDGSTCWYYIRLSPITKDGNEIFGLLLEQSDISERKNAEENLKAAYSRIQEHIASIKEMAWKQSHLIRGPLANLKGLTQILKDNSSDFEALDYLSSELQRLDDVLIEMAIQASLNDNV